MAANVISFVQFTSDLLKSTREIYGSMSGCATDVESLAQIYGRLRTLSDSLKARECRNRSASGLIHTVDSMDIDGLAALCKADCDSLLEITRTLKSGSTSTSKWLSFKVALRKAWKQKSITELEQRLSRIQSIITLKICKQLEYVSNLLRILLSRTAPLNNDPNER